ncbi:hypothetical protein DPX16_20224 [Anabarilius grahami]|uniref:Uncharacterized protein n=1 Tax=Anabarilius grahami TaxID=495550 RepID=A0A3N0XE72_ANAGA|nr:hypothetical protein DPX16_20224 [Anabarilius grahami]
MAKQPARARQNGRGIWLYKRALRIGSLIHSPSAMTINSLRWIYQADQRAASQQPDQRAASQQPDQRAASQQPDQLAASQQPDQLAALKQPDQRFAHEPPAAQRALVSVLPLPLSGKYNSACTASVDRRTSYLQRREHLFQLIPCRLLPEHS